eukprot:366546-Chlamydomonas_euryale.AAC.53
MAVRARRRQRVPAGRHRRTCFPEACPNLGHAQSASLTHIGALELVGSAGQELKRVADIASHICNGSHFAENVTGNVGGVNMAKEEEEGNRRLRWSCEYGEGRGGSGPAVKVVV